MGCFTNGFCSSVCKYLLSCELPCCRQHQCQVKQLIFFPCSSFPVSFGCFAAFQILPSLFPCASEPYLAPGSACGGVRHLLFGAAVVEVLCVLFYAGVRKRGDGFVLTLVVISFLKAVRLVGAIRPQKPSHVCESLGDKF